MFLAKTSSSTLVKRRPQYKQYVEPWAFDVLGAQSTRKEISQSWPKRNETVVLFTHKSVNGRLKMYMDIRVMCLPKDSCHFHACLFETKRETSCVRPKVFNFFENFRTAIEDKERHVTETRTWDRRIFD